MSEAKKFYVCSICGNQVELVVDGGGELICCGEPMTLKDKSCESAKDKHHELILEEIPGGIRVRVGAEGPHPMKADHFIQWIECWIGKHVFRKDLTPDSEPEAEFHIEEYTKEGEKPAFRAFCNVHGLRYCECCGK